MRSLFYCSIVVIAFTFSYLTAQKPSTALELNNYLASITDSLHGEGQKWGLNFNKAFKSKDFSILVADRKRLEDYVQRKRVDVVTLKDIGGSENLRLAMLDFLSFEARMITEAFMIFEKFDSKSPDDAIKKAFNSLTEKTTDENKYLDEVRLAQKAYGEKNGFTISQ